MTSSDTVDKFKESFRSVGKLKGYQVRLHVKADAIYVVEPLRRPPFSLRDKIDKKLDQLESMDIIEKVNIPSHESVLSWLSQNPTGGGGETAWI